MLGAIIGDIIGSRFEWNNIKTKRFELFAKECFPTDDTVMTLAIANAILECDGDYDLLGQRAVEEMQRIGRLYPDMGYGGRFSEWIFSACPKPYNSYGNGAAMRVSACGYAARNLQEAKCLARAVTEVTHNHPEGLKGAESVAVAVFMALHGSTLSEIEGAMRTYYPLNFTLDSVRSGYSFDVTCQGSVPQAFRAFLEATGFEDAVRNAVSLGGDSDTLAAIAGSVAGAYYGVPAAFRTNALRYLDGELLGIVRRFEERFGGKREKYTK